MGTNYFLHYDGCECCGRYSELHIGKSTSSLRAYVRYDFEDDKPTKFGDIKTWADWKAILIPDSHTVWDEYGRQIDKAEFIALMERHSLEDRSRQFRYMEAHYPLSVTTLENAQPQMNWLDPEDGFSMYAGEFS